jgi:hypothetical protein
MSQRRTTTVTCPHCGHSQDFSTWPSLNVSLDPDEKPRLLSGELHRFTCGKCASQTQVSYPLLYHDMERKLMLYNLEEGDTPEVLPDGILGGLLGIMRESYSFRQVHSRNELVEKIRIADAGLDDRVVEIFKVILRGQNTELSEGDLYFSYIQAAPNEDSVIAFYWLGDDGGKEVAMPLATYRAYETHLGNLVAADHEPAGQWQRVDLAYAADLVARQSRSPQS